MLIYLIERQNIYYGIETNIYDVEEENMDYLFNFV